MTPGFPRRSALLALVSVGLTVASAAAESPSRPPIVPGFERFQAAWQTDAVKGGQLLLAELNCVSCHQAGKKGMDRKPAPVLDGVANRVRIGYLRKFLRDPQAVKPGGTMPNLFVGDADRDEKIEALVHFLATTGSLKQERLDPRTVAPGKDLYHKVGCVACHGSRDAGGRADKVLPGSVPLGDLKAKYSITSLAAFLDNPHQVRPGGRMPKIVSGKDAKSIANYLLQGPPADYLLGQGTTRFAVYEGAWDKLPDFAKLKPLAQGVGPAFDLAVAKRSNNYGLQFEGFFGADQEGAYQFRVVSDDGSRLAIDGRLVVDNDGVHPARAVTGSAHLTRGVHRVTVAFFQAGGGAELEVQIEGPGLGWQDLGALVADSEAAFAKQRAPARQGPAEDRVEWQPALVAKGQALFASSGCANCHALTVNQQMVAAGLPATRLSRLKGEGGCLAAAPSRGVPWFALSPGQRAALAAAIKAPAPVSKEPAEVIARTLMTFNCYACHTRGKVGGPEEALNPFFQTTQPEMGDEGRVPPPLDNVGAKLNPDYLKQILDHGTHDRPYMHTKMPGFGQANVGQLVEAFRALDKLPATPAVRFADPVSKVKATGRHMVGSKGFGCVSCHIFAGHKAQGVQGIDMTLMAKRLQRDWFHAYLLDPQKVRPGTRMPTAWPNGQTVLPELLDGQAATQIEAIWVYLQDGSNAQPPIGLNKESIPLVPDKTAILYRNFVQGAGPRAIAVGYPEKAHLAFDANEMRLAMLWQGAFIDAARHWTDRGSGYEPPLGDNILHLPAGVSFAVLATPEAVWPTAPAREQGFQFKGYRLTPDDRPTFLYSFGGVEVEDFPNPVAGKEPSMRRTLKLSAREPVDNLCFRAAVGNKIESAGDGWYRIDGWKMKVAGGVATVLRKANGKTELLVPIRFVDRAAQITQEFAW